MIGALAAAYFIATQLQANRWWSATGASIRREFEPHRVTPD